MNLNVSIKGLKDWADDFGATEKEAAKALKRAVARTTRWLNSQLARRAAKATKVRVGVFKERGRVRMRIRDDWGSIWVGMNPIDLHHIGARQNKKGVRAGPVTVKGGWILKNYGGERALEGKVFKRRGDARYPIDKQQLEIAEQVEPIVEALYQEALSKLEKELTHELQWITRKK